MLKLKDAVMDVLMTRQEFSVQKQNNIIKDDDLLCVHSFIKKDEILQAEDGIEVKKLIKDKTVLKRYFSTEIPEDLEYLAFISLGIEYLKIQAEYKDAEKGRNIFYKKIVEEMKKIQKEDFNGDYPEVIK